MVSRKSHPKSRNGCANCKKRRIKCDEVKPQCSNCEKHSIDCDFSSTSWHTPKSASTSSSSPQAQRHRSSASSSKPASKSRAASSTDNSPALPNSYLDGSGAKLPGLQLEDLELLHHFTTQTCFTLSDRAASHELWRVNAPQVAFQHDFLMRGILAISALHMAWLKPDKKDHYSHIAVRQQDAALSAFRSIMSKMDQTNCDAFFGLSSLIVVYGFAAPKASDSLGLFSYSGDDSDEWLPLIRGVNSILMNVFPWIKQGRLSGLLHDHQQEPPRQDLPPVLKDQLSHLETLCERVADGQEAADAYRTTLTMLRMCFIRMKNRPPYECEVSISFLWPVMIPQDYISLLNRRRPEALIILAHYCVILHHLDDYWWMRGWAMHIIDNIKRELNDEQRFWIEWPTRVITSDEKVLTNGTLETPISRNRVSNKFTTAIDQALELPSEAMKAS